MCLLAYYAGICLAYLLLLICVRGVFVSAVETHRLRVFGFGYFSFLAYVKLCFSAKSFAVII